MQDTVIVADPGPRSKHAYAYGLKGFDNYARDFDNMHTVDNLGLASKLYGNF